MYKGSLEYRRQEILGASPLHLVIMTYDLGIRACEQKDLAMAIKVISGLRDVLNMDYADAALGLMSLYEWCMDCIRQGDFESARTTLVELREAWVTVERNLNPMPVQAAQNGVSLAMRAA